MAPKRGGGGGGGLGGSGSGASNACPYAFIDTVYSPYPWRSIAYFVNYCLFFVLFAGLAVSLCCCGSKRRGTTSKRLVGPVYILSIVFALICYALLIIGTLLRECRTTDYYTYYDWSLASNLFIALSNYFLLVVVVWSVNMLLRERLGSGRSVYKGICLGILIVMGLLTCGWIGLSSYSIWTATPAGIDAGADSLGDQMNQLGLAYYILFMIFVLASGAMSIATLVTMRSRKMAVGGALGWTIVLTFCMFLWNLFLVIEYSDFQPNVIRRILTIEAIVAFDYLINFFQLFSFICILFLAKSRVWDSSADQNAPQNAPQNGYQNGYQSGYQQGPPPPQQQAWNGQQYAYHGHPGQQPYYQNQPVYNGVPELGHGLPHEAK